MTEYITKASWLILALIHLTPALVLFSPDLVEKLYGISASDEVGLLILHRGGLFLAVLVSLLLACFFTDMRRLASLITAISVISFLYVYGRAGFPESPIRKIAVIDGFALLPLFWVIWQSWIVQKPL